MTSSPSLHTNSNSSSRSGHQQHQQQLKMNNLHPELSSGKYAAQITILKDLFSTWTETDLIDLLLDLSGDLDEAIGRISSGHAEKWGQVSNNNNNSNNSASFQSTPKKSAGGGGMKNHHPSSATLSSSRGGRGASSSIRGGRGGNRGGGRGGSHATHPSSSPSVVGESPEFTNENKNATSAPSTGKGATSGVPSSQKRAAGAPAWSVAPVAVAAAPASAPLSDSTSGNIGGGAKKSAPSKTFNTTLAWGVASAAQPIEEQTVPAVEAVAVVVAAVEVVETVVPAPSTAPATNKYPVKVPTTTSSGMSWTSVVKGPEPPAPVVVKAPVIAKEKVIRPPVSDKVVGSPVHSSTSAPAPANPVEAQSKVIAAPVGSGAFGKSKSQEASPIQSPIRPPNAGHSPEMAGNTTPLQAAIGSKAPSSAPVQLQSNQSVGSPVVPSSTTVPVVPTTNSSASAAPPTSRPNISVRKQFKQEVPVVMPNNSSLSSVDVQFGSFQINQMSTSTAPPAAAVAAGSNKRGDLSESTPNTPSQQQAPQVVRPKETTTVIAGPPGMVQHPHSAPPMSAANSYMPTNQFGMGGGMAYGAPAPTIPSNEYYGAADPSRAGLSGYMYESIPTYVPTQQPLQSKFPTPDVASSVPVVPASLAPSQASVAAQQQQQANYPVPYAYYPHPYYMNQFQSYQSPQYVPPYVNKGGYSSYNQSLPPTSAGSGIAGGITSSSGGAVGVNGGLSKGAAASSMQHQYGAYQNHGYPQHLGYTADEGMDYTKSYSHHQQAHHHQHPQQQQQLQQHHQQQQQHALHQQGDYNAFGGVSNGGGKEYGSAKKYQQSSNSNNQQQQQSGASSTAPNSAANSSAAGTTGSTNANPTSSPGGAPGGMNVAAAASSYYNPMMHPQQMGYAMMQQQQYQQSAYTPQHGQQQQEYWGGRTQ